MEKALHTIRSFFQSAVFKLCQLFYSLKYRKPLIIFESAPVASDNTKAVYDEMKNRNLDRKYTFIWAIHQNETLPTSQINHYFVGSSISHHAAKELVILKKAKCEICCNIPILPARSIPVFYLSHGGPIKYVRDYYTVPEFVHYCFAPSEDGADKLSFQFNCPREKMVGLGYPRNDVLSAEHHPSFFDRSVYRKIIVWYPTFRQHRGGNQLTACSNSLPIIHDTDAAVRINDCARSLGILLVLKPHFAQDTHYIKDLHLSNILFIDDSFFRQHSTSSYEFIASCDALITDYSSVYYDYLLCDRPVAAIWEDLDEYRQKPGFAVDIDYYWKAAEKIYDIGDFLTFLDHVSSGADPLKEERNEICRLVNYSDDGKNAERVTDFIIEKAGL